MLPRQACGFLVLLRLFASCTADQPGQVIVTTDESKDAGHSADSGPGGGFAVGQQPGAGAAGQGMGGEGSGGSMSGGGTNAAGASSTIGDAAVGDTDVAVDRTVAAVTACEEGFGAEHSCNRNAYGLICTELEIYTVLHNDACIDAAIDAFKCETARTCPALDDFLNGPAADPYCGPKAKHYQETCGFQPEPPPAASRIATRPRHACRAFLPQHAPITATSKPELWPWASQPDAARRMTRSLAALPPSIVQH